MSPFMQLFVSVVLTVLTILSLHTTGNDPGLVGAMFIGGFYGFFIGTFGSRQN